MFSAPTDFRVGEAVKYLGTKGYRTVVKYRPSVDPRGEEAAIIKDLRSLALILLNCLSGFDFQKADESEERSRVQSFMDTMLPH
jgi:hypothetical protein